MTEAERLKHIVENGRVKDTIPCVQALLDQGYDRERIVSECIMPALAIVGDRFEKQEIFISHMMMAARTVNAINEYMKQQIPTPVASGNCKVVIGTVKDDLHFIGKNIVAMSMQAMGIEVVDLGVDVPVEQFVNAAERDDSVAIVAISALLTTTMPMMKKTVKALKKSPVSKRIKIMVGGGPVTQEFASSIGADYYTATGFEAANIAKQLLKEQKIP